MEHIPPYLLSTAYGEQYRHLCQHIDRSGGGIPTSTPILSTAITDASNGSSLLNASPFQTLGNLYSSSNKSHPGNASNVIGLSNTTSASTSTSTITEKPPKTQVDPESQEAVVDSADISKASYSVPPSSSAPLSTYSIWNPPVSNSFSSATSSLVPSTLRNFRDEGLNPATAFSNIQSPTATYLPQIQDQSSIYVPGAGRSHIQAFEGSTTLPPLLSLTGAASQTPFDPSLPGPNSSATTTVGYGNSNSNTATIFSIEAAFGERAQQERESEQSYRGLGTLPSAATLNNLTGLQGNPEVDLGLDGEEPQENSQSSQPTRSNVFINDYLGRGSSEGGDEYNDLEAIRNSLGSISSRQNSRNTDNNLRDLRTSNIRRGLSSNTRSSAPISTRQQPTDNRESAQSNISNAAEASDVDYSASTSVSLLCMGLAPLPSRWMFRNGAQGSGSYSYASANGEQVFSVLNGLHITYTSEAKTSAQEVKTFRTDFSIPSLCGVYYYEVDILEASRDTTISVGFCTNEARLSKIPGHDTHTWGYHSDDGRAISPLDHGIPYGHKYGAGDTVGCGFDFKNRKIFFTKNGIFLGDAYSSLNLEMGIRNKGQVGIVGTEAFNDAASSPVTNASAESTSSSSSIEAPGFSTGISNVTISDLNGLLNRVRFPNFFGGNPAVSSTTNPTINASTGRNSRGGRHSNNINSTAAVETIKEIFPCIGFKPSVEIKTNFGDSEFRFDIERYIKGEKEQLMDDIMKSGELPLGVFKPRASADSHLSSTENGGSTSTPIPESSSTSEQPSKLQEEDMSEFIQGLVSSYFSYMGYLDTARAFKNECIKEQKLVDDAVNPIENKNTKSVVDQDTEMTDISDNLNSAEDEYSTEDLNILNRQKIGNYIVSGKIDKSLKLLATFYPQVIQNEKSLVVFKLRCQKFIELAKKTFIDDKENIDTDDDLYKTNLTPNISSTGIANEDSDDEMPINKEEALQTAIKYGQELREIYKNDSRSFVQDKLSKTFSLLAYEKAPVTSKPTVPTLTGPLSLSSVPYSTGNEAYSLLSPAERYALAEEVNAQILVTMGKQPIPALKKVVQNTMSLVWDLTNFRDRLETSVLNVHQDYLY